jgi:mannan endo-1,4-beta-mannosidase
MHRSNLPTMRMVREKPGPTLRPSPVPFVVLFACLAAAPLSANANGVANRIPAAPGAKPARISLSVPRKVVREAPALARGKVTHAPRRGRVLLERRNRNKWLPLARGKVGYKAFRISFVLTGVGHARVRAVLFQGKRRLATSIVRTVRVETGGAPTGRVYWGAWIGSQLTGAAAPWDMTAVSKFEQMIGKPQSMLQFGLPFADCSTSPCSYYDFPATAFDRIRAKGAIPFLSWSSQPSQSSPTQPDFQLSDLIAGAYDEYIRSFATEVEAWGHPFFLRFNWEMNLNWIPWGEGVNGNQPGEFVMAWRRVHDIFTSVGATNATWVWCPYANRTSTSTFRSLYPGDGYVDWTCLDGYNWGPHAAPPRSWKSFNSQFSGAYHQIVDIVAPSKPMVIGETASTEYGGSKAKWIQDMFKELPTEFPKIRGLLWFELSDKNMDWPLESSESALRSFAAGIKDSRYVSNTAGGIATAPIPAP